MSQKLMIYRSVPEFIQGPGVLNLIGEQAALLSSGRPVYVLLDPCVRFLQKRIESSLAGQDVSFEITLFDGNLNLGHVERLAGKIEARLSPSVYIGVGSGKTIDLSKMLARRSGTRNVIVATASATDAASSHAAVGVDDRGHVKARNYDAAPDLVLVDSEVIAKAPVRLFVAGIGDALSKKHELETAVALGEHNFFGADRPYFIDSLAVLLYDTLLTRGRAARAKVEQGMLSEEVEQVITACVLLSTLVWENGGLAGAHSIANVLFNSGYCSQALHGEQVAFGLLLHLALENAEHELKRLLPFYREVGLPRTLSALSAGLTDTEAGALTDRPAVREIAEGIHLRWKKHNLNFSAREILGAIGRLEMGSSNAVNGSGDNGFRGSGSQRSR